MEEKQENMDTEETFVEPDSKSDTKILVYAILFILLLFGVFFVTRFFVSDEQELESYSYNGFDFFQLAGLWHTKWQRENELFSIHLRYGPRESEDIEILASGEDKSFSINEDVYITFDPEGEDLAYVALASTELSLSLKNVFLINATAACLVNETEPCFTRPIVTCENTDKPVIYVKEANETAVTIDNNCLIVQGRGEEIVRAADRVIWGWYGIISDLSVTQLCDYYDLIGDDSEAFKLAAQQNDAQCPGTQTCQRAGECQEIEVEEGTALICIGVCG